MRTFTEKLPGHLLTGQKGEDLAAAYLRGLRLDVLDRNWRPSASSEAGAAALEIDLVAQEGDLLIFAEVKTRIHRPGSSFNPQDAFTAAKCRKLRRAVALYLEERGQWKRPCRFDLLCVYLAAGGMPPEVDSSRLPPPSFKLEHFKNVLSFQPPSRRTSAGFHTPWQPW